MRNSKTKMIKILYLCVGLFLFFVSSFPAYAQLDPTKIRIGGEIRERYEYRDNTDFNDNKADTLSFAVSRTRVHLGVDVTSNIDTYVQIQDSRVFGSEASTASNDGNLDLHQGYINLKNVGGAPLAIKLGRQEIFFGDHRLVGNFGWSNIGRSFDGARLTYKAPMGSVDVWATTVKKENTRLATIDTVAGTGSATSADVATATQTRNAQSFYGIYASLKPAPILTIEPYLMDRMDTTTAPIENRYTLGVRADAKAGMIDATGELAYQLGDSAKVEAGKGADISAFALALKAGVTLPAPMSPRVGVEYDMASGDDNAADGDDGTFNNLFPTNHDKYGYMDLVGWQNMNDIRLSISAKPTPATAVSLDYHIFSLAEKNDNWYRASGVALRKPTEMTGDSIGSELDLWGSIMVMEKLKIDGAIAFFMPGDVVAPDDNSTWFYLQGTVPF